MVKPKTFSALTVAALLCCTVPTQSIASSFLTPIIGQAVPSFPIPDSVAKGTKVSLASSSTNMNAISETLAKGFEKQYSGKVSVTTTDANKAIQEVLSGNVDLAAISRPLTEAEKAKGLIAVPVRREKIAIVVGKDNPIASSLTGSQFAQIFRGEIKDWSSVGGTPGPIKVIDRPEANETRQSLKPYPVFTTAEFKTGSNATQLTEDSSAALAKALGKDGIGYALVGQIQGQSEIKAIQLHKTLPDDPRYPFSQPYSYVYAGGASPAVAAFLGYATGSPGQSALNSADLSGYAVAPVAGEAATGTSDATKAAGTNSATGADTGTSGTGGTDGTTSANSADAGGAGSANGNTATGESANAGDQGTNAQGTDAQGTDAQGANVDGTARGIEGLSDGRGRWWWLLLPLAGLGLLIWAAGRRSAEEETGYTANVGGINAGVTPDDMIRSSYRGDNLPDTRLDTVETGTPAAPIGSVGSINVEPTDIGTASVGTTSVGTASVGAADVGALNLGKVAAGGAALAGGAAAAGAGLAGNIKNKADDAAVDLGGNFGAVQGGVDGIKGSVQSGLGNLRSNIQVGVQDGVQGVQGRANDALTTIQGTGEDLKTSNLQGNADGIRTTFQGNNVDSLKSEVQGTFGSSVEASKGIVQDSGSSWLDRAKQRINEATDQIKDTSLDIKDNITDIKNNITKD